MSLASGTLKHAVNQLGLLARGSHQVDEMQECLVYMLSVKAVLMQANTSPRMRSRVRCAFLQEPSSPSAKLFCCLFREARKDDWKSRQQAVKQDMLSQKLAAANAREQAKMAMFRDMIAPGVPMVIPKRQ